MAFLEFKNVRISGISAGVPKHVEYNKDYPYLRKVRRRNTSPLPPLGKGVSLIPGFAPLIFAIRLRNVL